MFCTKCGKELREDWSVCPYCGNEWYEEENKGRESACFIDDEDDDVKNEKKLIKKLICEHPVRSVLCIPIIIYMIFLLYEFMTYNFSSGKNIFAIIIDLLPIFFRMDFCGVVALFIYGPLNYKQVKEEVTQKPQKEYRIILDVLGLIVVFILMSCTSNIDKGTEYTEEESSSEMVSNESSNSMTMEEYINSCQEITGEDISRNPELFIGKDIILEGRFDILAGEIVMNWFTDSGIIGIKYNGKAVDMQGNIIGDVMTGDYGYVAGRYEGEDDWGHKYINAQIIILDRAE